MYVSIDIGGTNTRVATFDSFQTPVIKNKLSWIDRRKEVRLLISNIQDLSKDVQAIGIGITERTSSSALDVEQVHLDHEKFENETVNILKTEFNCPVYLENDAVVAALAIAYYGEKTHEDYIYLTWGTGIGGSRVWYEEGKLKFEKLDWNKYFKKWEVKCGGRYINYFYKKDTSELNEDEWEKIIKDFEDNFDHIRSKFKDKKFYLGGGIAEKKKELLINKLEGVEFTRFGEDIGLYGGLALIMNKT